MLPQCCAGYCAPVQFSENMVRQTLQLALLIQAIVIKMEFSIIATGANSANDVDRGVAS